MLIHRRSLPVLVVLLLGVGLSGCTETRKALGYDKSAPNEFQVVKRAPLQVPEVFNLLPPVPGAQRPQEQDPAGQARQALTSRPSSRQNSTSYGIPSPSLQTFLRTTKVYHSLPDIRAIIDREAVTTLLEGRSITDRMVFWREVVSESGPVVDADKELHRLRENQALGYAINDRTVPVQVPRRRGILEYLF